MANDHDATLAEHAPDSQAPNWCVFHLGAAFASRCSGSDLCFAGPQPAAGATTHRGLTTCFFTTESPWHRRAPSWTGSIETERADADRGYAASLFPRLAHITIRPLRAQHPRSDLVMIKQSLDGRLHE